MGGGAPKHLHQILAQADVVAVVTVAACERPPDRGQTQATLQVERIIHGRLQGKSVVVENVDPNECMGPAAKYVVGERVLVFLNQHARNRYTTCGLAFGAKVLDDQQRAACIQRVQEFHRIRAVKGDAKRKSFWAEWAVRCAEEPATREDGLSLLCRGTRGELGSEPLPDEPTRYYPLLNPSQQDRLFETLNRLRSEEDAYANINRLMRVIAYAFQDEPMLKIADMVTDLLQANDNRPSHLEPIPRKIEALLDEFGNRYDDLKLRRAGE